MLRRIKRVSRKLTSSPVLPIFALTKLFELMALSPSDVISWIPVVITSFIVYLFGENWNEFYDNATDTVEEVSE